ncbi:ion-transporting ATPase domain protein [Mycobacterium kansasii]|uniref:Ion-transporting ATPase domain protein n=1 Tax=Mycobacterium kansasii TaxID=1768 RepID=A0A1V3XAK6_MYCKA|nr:ion-transporting ATPase domain protein [Mycobacterium kansasii]
MGLAMKAMSTVLGSKMLSDAATFVQSLDATFGVSGRRLTEPMRC